MGKELKKLRSVRLEKGYTLLYMAKQLGITKVFYWQIENGGRRLNYFMAKKIASIFNMKPDELFYEDF